VRAIPAVIDVENFCLQFVTLDERNTDVDCTTSVGLTRVNAISFTELKVRDGFKFLNPNAIQSLNVADSPVPKKTIHFKRHCVKFYEDCSHTTQIVL